MTDQGTTNGDRAERRKLTGREIAARKHGEKLVMLAKDVTGKTFDGTVTLLQELTHVENGRFLAFGDSRK